MHVGGQAGRQALQLRGPAGQAGQALLQATFGAADAGMGFALLRQQATALAKLLVELVAQGAGPGFDLIHPP